MELTKINKIRKELNKNSYFEFATLMIFFIMMISLFTILVYVKEENILSGVYHLGLIIPFIVAGYIIIKKYLNTRKEILESIIKTINPYLIKTKLKYVYTDGNKSFYTYISNNSLKMFEVNPDHTYLKKGDGDKFYIINMNNYSSRESIYQLKDGSMEEMKPTTHLKINSPLKINSLFRKKKVLQILQKNRKNAND